jgi:TRAP-type transport system small permease protein
MTDEAHRGASRVSSQDTRETTRTPGEAAGEAATYSSLGIRIEEALGATVMAIIALITFANVVVRYATDFSFAFTEEISVALVVVVTLIGASLTVAKDRHIRVEYFLGKAPVRWQPWVLFASMVPVAATMLVLVVAGAFLVYDEYKFGITSPGLAIPQWWYTGWLPLLGFVILLRTIAFMRGILKRPHA